MLRVALLGRAVPVLRTDEGLRAVAKDQYPMAPAGSLPLAAPNVTMRQAHHAVCKFMSLAQQWLKRPAEKSELADWHQALLARATISRHFLVHKQVLSYLSLRVAPIVTTTP